MKELVFPKYIKIEEFQKVSKKELASYLDNIGKNKWRRSIETSDIHSFRMNSANDNSLVALYVFRDNAPKDKCVECYVKVAK